MWKTPLRMWGSVENFGSAIKNVENSQHQFYIIPNRNKQKARFVTVIYKNTNSHHRENG